MSRFLLVSKGVSSGLQLFVFFQNLIEQAVLLCIIHSKDTTFSFVMITLTLKFLKLKIKCKDNLSSIYAF